MATRSTALEASSSTALQGTRDERLEQHCYDLVDSLLKAYYMKDVYLKCTDEVSVPVHKYVLGAQSECASVVHASARHGQPVA